MTGVQTCALPIYVRLHLVGAYLLVQDNSYCGGANVRFDGVYVRTGR